MKWRYRIEVLKKRAGWYVRVKARNYKILGHSEQYHSKGNAMHAAKNLNRDLADSVLVVK